MANDNSETDASPTHEQNQDSVERTPEQALRAEARRYASVAAERPPSIASDRDHIIELLRTEVSDDALEAGLFRRAAASTALVHLARNDGGSFSGTLDSLVAELRTERRRELPAEQTRARVASETSLENLIRTIGLVVTDQPDVITETASAEFFRAITADRDPGTIRVAAKALFASAAALQHPEEAVATGRELTHHPDSTVRAWSAGALGRLAEEHPAATAAAVDDLRELLPQDDETVLHNTVEALGALVQSRPAAVAPAADDLRALLAHDEVAIQHNVAGIFARLATTQPDAVVPAVDDLVTLSDHNVAAVRRMASEALVRLARERPDAITED